MSGVVAVTGAFSNIGAAAARVLHERDWVVRTLTNRAAPTDVAYVESVHPLRFQREALVESLRGVDVLVNTYWVRLPDHGASFDDAVANTFLLLDAAREAGVRRVVQVSVSNASTISPSPYYAGKARIDEQIRSTWDSWSIVRPTLVVGPRDVLTSNMAWFIRRSPLVAVPTGTARLRPVLLDDVGSLLADRVEATDDLEVDAAGAEEYTFDEYLRLLTTSLGLRRRFVRVPHAVFLAATGLAGIVLRDTIVARDELSSLHRDSLYTPPNPACASSVRAWLLAHARELGARYVNDRSARRRSTRIASGRA